MRTSADSRGRRYGGGGDHDGRLHVAALANDRAAVHVLGSASLRTDAVDRRQASSRASSISVENEEELGSARMGRLARVGGNSTIAARERHRWALDTMQMGRGKGKRKTAVQGPEYQGLISVVAPVTPIRRSADGERQSLYFAHAMCTDRDLVAGVARAQLPYAANMVSGVDAAGCARGAGPGTAEAAARLTGMRCEGRGNFD